MTHDTAATSPTAFSTGGGFARYCAMEACDMHYFTEEELDAELDELLLNPLDNMGAL